MSFENLSRFKAIEIFIFLKIYGYLCPKCRKFTPPFIVISYIIYGILKGSRVKIEIRKIERNYPLTEEWSEMNET